jgi:V8-like Glu-specific endopeptidase
MMLQWKFRALQRIRTRHLRIYCGTLAALALIVYSTLLANAQDTKGYPESWYKLLDPWTHFGQEALVPPKFEIILGNETRFEPAMALRSLDKITRPVGRLEIKRRWKDGTLDATWCTAFLVSSNQALTNYHCIPGSPTQYTIAEARARFNYLDQGQADTQAFSVISYSGANEQLDFTVLNLERNPGSTYGIVSLNVRDPVPGESLIIVHHPYSLPKRVTRFQCKTRAPDLMPGDAREFRHQCDTLGGSSGAPVFTDSDYKLVGLHHVGVPQGLSGGQAYNLAVRMVKILAASELLTRLAAPEKPVPPRIIRRAPRPGL